MPRVYRVHFDDGSEATEQDLRNAILGVLGHDEDHAILRQIDIFPSCYTPTEDIVALVKFASTPRFLSKLDANPTSDVSTILEYVGAVVFDAKFTNFTPLNRPDESQGIVADIIAISGLGGHAYGSWAHHNNGASFMWIHDALPDLFRNCRIMLYGYDSKLGSLNTSLISDYCRGLSEHLNMVRGSNGSTRSVRPIIFITHSFGGIIAANTLIQTHSSGDSALYNAIDAFMFFGTPHKGLVVDEIRKMLVDPKHPQSHLIGQLDVDNKFLGDQLHTFKNVLRDRKVCSFYEQQLTRSLTQGEDGRWSRCGPYLELSSREGSLLGLSDSNEHKVAINEDHSRMVKFKSRREGPYLSVVSFLREKILLETQSRVLCRTDPGYNPNSLVQWLSDVDFKEWEAKNIDVTNVVDIGQTFFNDEVFIAWEKQQIRHLECYGAVGSGKTYLAYQTVQRLEKAQNAFIKQQKKACSLVRLYIERESATSIKQLFGAMLIQLLPRNMNLMGRPYIISTELRLAHCTAVAEKREPTLNELIGFVGKELARKEHVFLVVDGFTEISRKDQGDFTVRIEGLQKQYSNRIGALYFKREDGFSPYVAPYCDGTGCGRRALVHYRCQHPLCLKVEFDLCQSCFSIDGGKRDHAYHQDSLKLITEVKYVLPARVEEMEVFIVSEVDKMVAPRSIQTADTDEGQLKPLRLAELCHDEPALLEAIPKCISLKLQGSNFRVAKEWFEYLLKQPTKRKLKQSLGQFPWRGRIAFAKDVRFFRDDEDCYDAQTGWNIVCLLLAAGTRQPLMPPEDLRAALAALIEPDDPLSSESKTTLSTIVELAQGYISVTRNKDGFLSLDSALFAFLYQSVTGKESLQQAHNAMATACLNYLNAKLPSLLESDHYRSNITFWDEPFLSYATAFWGDHLRMAGEGLRSEVFEEACRFLQNSTRVQIYINAAWVSSLSCTAPLQWDTNFGVHALHICAWFGLSSMIRRICKSSPVDTQEVVFGQTPLLYACRKGHQDTVATLLELGASPALLSNRGHNALFEAVALDESSDEYRRNKMQIVKMLLEDNRVDINASHFKSKHRTALHIAVLNKRNESLDFVEELLENRAELNCFDSRGFSPLMYAAREGKVAIVEMLLKKGASVDRYGRHWRFQTTALHLAMEAYLDCDSSELNGYRQIITTLLSHKACPRKQDAWGLDVLMKSQLTEPKITNLFSTSTCHAQQNILLDIYETFPEPSRDLMLHQAISSCNVREVEEVLLDNPSMAQKKDRHGRTPLHFAANKCNRHLEPTSNEERVEASQRIISLLAKHSDFSATDKWGFTAMDYALYNRCVRTQLALLDSGARFDTQRPDNLNILCCYAYTYQMADAVSALLKMGIDEAATYSMIVQSEPELGSLTTGLNDLLRYKQDTNVKKSQSKSRVILEQSQEKARIDYDNGLFERDREDHAEQSRLVPTEVQERPNTSSSTKESLVTGFLYRFLKTIL